MTSFFDEYELTEQGGSKAKFSRFAKIAPWNQLEPGLYNRGIVTVVDESYDDSFLKSWSWLIGDNYLLVGFTCWGDFFYADMDQGEFFIVLSSQQKKYPMGNSFSAVFDMNFSNSKFIEQILLPSLFEEFYIEVGSLKYGEVYYIDRKTGVKTIKDVSITLDILGQTGSQLR